MSDPKQEMRDLYYLGLAESASLRSKDPSTKTGAVIVSPRGAVIATGYNGFPQAMEDRPELYANREEKYSRIVHCEMNALIFAQKDLTGCTLYTWPFMSCDRCVVHMIQAGIVTFVFPKAPPESLTRWGAAFEKVMSYIDECRLERREIKVEKLLAPSSRG